MNDTLIIISFLAFYFSPVFYQIGIVIKENKQGNKIPLRRLKNILKYSFLILTPLLLGFAALTHTNYLDYEKPITYDKIDQITFENFRGLEFFKKSLYGNKRFAYVVVSMESEIKEDYVVIKSLFHPSRSFVYNSYSNSKELLTHEMYHFKIMELYVRKIKKCISELKNNKKDQIKDIINQKKIEEREFQQQYDYDTFHSYVFSEQKKYEKQIDSLLNLLSEFENPQIKLNE
ncbi:MULTISPECIES: hypothetical protein [unclassified Arenibacter]|uniref:hypothetical protein n=1 Tax=unclassified Arenibacter TaxID=2615047 RepID=UPI000E352504|nr:MULTISPECIES: hypothetical protein [unclassified Arenibacter]MCM4165974.1 hypothetical protein [Arenibacter sp. A80]RFT54362.1 hypothetical protein D0S24_20430 [Arenibacter sp. P308M17]